jgi:hypothetical protein
MKKNLTALLTLTSALLISDFNYAQWKLTGNAGTNPSTNFVGTTDKEALVFRTNNVERMRILPTGSVGVGIKTPKGLLNVALKNTVSLSSPGSFLIGAVNSSNLAMDANNIQARNNGAAGNLYLNAFGGTVQVGSNNALIALNGQAGIGGNVNNSFVLTVNATSARGAYLLLIPKIIRQFSLQNQDSTTEQHFRRQVQRVVLKRSTVLIPAQVPL